MKEEDFNKATKRDKLKMPAEFITEQIPCSKVLFIPIPKKVDRYGMSATFVLSEGKWIRLVDYDCFRFNIDEGFVKGDFEHNGIVFFLGRDATIEYGNEIRIKGSAR